MKITAKQLSGEHIGKTITVHHEGTELTGMYTGLDIEADIIIDRRLCQIEPSLTIGRPEYQVRVGYKSISIEPDTRITIQEAQ